MTNERNNRLILDNVPFNINAEDFTSHVSKKPADKSKQKEDTDLVDGSDTESTFQD